MERVDRHRELEGFDSLCKLALAEEMAAEGALGTCKAVLRELPRLLKVLRLLLQISQATPEPWRGRRLEQLFHHIHGLDVSFGHHEAIYRLRPHPQSFELLVRCADHAHFHHAHAQLPLQVEARRISRPVDEEEAVPSGGTLILELVHEGLELKGRALPCLVAVVLCAATVEEAATESEPIGGEHWPVTSIRFHRLLLRGEHTLRKSIHLLEHHLVVSVRRSPEVVAPREQD
mmetsp:Transcript_101730/g.217834  ORF Transcript_101730/g.217834 Transcript_101730/m.217834 type:complete len:232 (-) Transcript_101730:571-1266(-)